MMENRQADGQMFYVCFLVVNNYLSVEYKSYMFRTFQDVVSQQKWNKLELKVYCDLNFYTSWPKIHNYRQLL